MIKATISKLSAKYHIDSNYFIKNGLISNFYFVVISLIGIAANIILARYFTKSDFGFYKQFYFIMSFVMLITLSGMPKTLIISLVKKKGGSIKDAIKLRLCGSIAAIIAIIGYVYYMFANNPSFYEVILVGGIIYIIDSFISLYRTNISARKDFALSGKIDSFKEILKFIVILSTFFLPLDYGQVIIYMLLAVMALNILYLFKEKKHIHINNDKDEEFIPASLKESAMDIWNVISKKLDLIVVLALYDPAIFAVYSIANVIPNSIAGVYMNIAKVATPKMIENDSKIIKKRISGIYFKLLGLSFLICIASILATPFIIKILLGDKYLASILPTQILLAGMAFSATVVLMNTYYLSTRKFKLRYLNITISLVSKAVLLFALSRYGIVGLAAAVAASRAITSILGYLVFLR